MYNIFQYGRIFAEGPRTLVYASILEKVITPESVVVDIGTGTGIFAFLACQFGAKRVYAIENEDVIQVAKDIARTNGYQDRIKFIQDMSTNVELPELAHVIVSDLRGVLPLYQKHIPTIIDARQRLLAEGGILIPQKDILFATLVSAPDLYDEFTSPWDAFAFDMQIGRDYAVNTTCKFRPKSDQLLTQPQSFAELDYRTIESATVSGTLELKILKNADAHGFCVWFDSEVADGYTFSNRPEALKLIYGTKFFPLQEAISVRVGDMISVSFQAKLVGDDYIWQWNTEITTSLNVYRFKQSTFSSIPLSIEKLRKTSLDYSPRLNTEGEIALSAIKQIKEHVSSGEIAKTLFENFDGHFVDEASAQSFVQVLVAKYSV